MHKKYSMFKNPDGDGSHRKFKRSKYLEETFLDKQYPIKFEKHDQDAYLIPNIEYPFNQCRIAFQDADNDKTYYLYPRKETYRTRLLHSLYPTEALGWTENPVEALMFSSSSGYRQLSALQAVSKIKDIAKCSIGFLPDEGDWFNIDTQVCWQAESMSDTDDEVFFIIAIALLGNTFMINKPRQLKRKISWDESVKGYTLNLSSCLHRATWRWTKEELAQIAARTKLDPYSGIIKEAKQCLYNHPLCRKKRYAPHIGLPEIYLLDPVSFRINHVERFNNVALVHTAADYESLQYEYKIRKH